MLFVINIIIVLIQTGTSTNISGTYTTNTTLTISNSPYYVIGNVEVSNGTALYIENGVELIFTGNNSTINVAGSINAGCYQIEPPDNNTFTYIHSNTDQPHGSINIIESSNAQFCDVLFANLYHAIAVSGTPRLNIKYNNFINNLVAIKASFIVEINMNINYNNFLDNIVDFEGLFYGVDAKHNYYSFGIIDVCYSLFDVGAFQPWYNSVITDIDNLPIECNNSINININSSCESLQDNNNCVALTITQNPTPNPTQKPTSSPTYLPTKSPTIDPTNDPTPHPTPKPTPYPTTLVPTHIPSKSPTTDPTQIPTKSPTINPTSNPTYYPTKSPSLKPTISPTSDPTINPTFGPTDNPIYNPTLNPTIQQTTDPSNHHTLTPTTPSPPEPDDLTCNNQVSGAYNNIALSFKVRMPFEGDLTFDATHSDFIITSITAINSTAVTIGSVNHNKIILRDIAYGYYTFTITANDNTTGIFDIRLICESDSPSSFPTIYPTHDPTYNPTHDPTLKPTNNPIFYSTQYPTDYPTNIPFQHTSFFETNPSFVFNNTGKEINSPLVPIRIQKWMVFAIVFSSLSVFGVMIIVAVVAKEYCCSFDVTETTYDKIKRWEGDNV